jgi:hypothetical protein
MDPVYTPHQVRTEVHRRFAPVCVDVFAHFVNEPRDIVVMRRSVSGASENNRTVSEVTSTPINLIYREPLKLFQKIWGESIARLPARGLVKDEFRLDNTIAAFKKPFVLCVSVGGSFRYERRLIRIHVHPEARSWRDRCRPW